ncbi:hypothetical protein R1flu_026633 [Riccia fluitans]|uniref:Ubiquitin-like protease family profile domain-containing protein n=1 Tax=Riccia fluitans TaxID=41844 RepID=A0ABD1XGH5_9MARC
MRIKMDGYLVKPLDPNVDATSQKKNKKKQTGSEQPSQKHPRFESDPKDGKEGNLPSAMETSRKGKKKVTESSHLPNVDIDVDIVAEERRTLKIGVKASSLEMDPPLSNPIGQTSGRNSNHMPASDTTKEVPPTSSKLPSDGIMEESVNQMTTMLSNILAHHECANQRLASLEEDLVHSKREEEKLKATIEALEKEKRDMNAEKALMERKDLYELLEAKMEGFQIANHPGMIGGFENLNLTIMRKWVEIPALNLEEFEKCPANYPEYAPLGRGWDGWKQIWHRTLQDRMGIDVCYQSLLDALKATVGTLPNSLAIFEYMRSIFDSYINPTNDPNVQPLVKGLDADDFSKDKFFGLQDPTSLDDQVSPDFEEDLRANECLRLRAEVRNLEVEPQRLTRSTCVHLDYEPTILPDVPPTDIPARPVTLDLIVDAREDPSFSAQSQIVPIPTFVNLTQYISFSENEGSEDQGWPRKEDLMKANLESAMYKGHYLQGDVINMYINERFLKKPREQLHNMFYVNTFWFTKANELVARYDKTNHVEEAMIKITRLRKSICPEFHNEDMQGNLPAWIYVPIHGKNHWSLAIIRIHNDVAMLAHLDSLRGTHDPEAIFHVLRAVLCLNVPIDPALVLTGIMNVEQQHDGHSYGKQVLQMLASVGMKESEGLDRCFREEGLTYIASLE